MGGKADRLTRGDLKPCCPGAAQRAQIQEACVSIEIDLPPGQPAAEAPGLAVDHDRGALLTIGIVNNMPDSALLGTERQFTRLLAAAAGTRRIRIRFACLDGIVRGDTVARHMDGRYWSLAALTASAPDALIVTGTEPKAGHVEDEPYWPSLCDVLEYAEGHLPTSLWSCLAAHAAVWRLDRVPRIRLADKRSGVFQHVGQSGHALLKGLPEVVPTPHSRWNEIRLPDLVGAGYEMLTSSADNGADLFAKRSRSLLVFCQGHPEYFADTLLREFRRDVGRFLAGERATYPAEPAGYFGPAARAALDGFSERARATPVSTRLADFPFDVALASASYRWAPAAEAFYGNWLGLVESLRRP